MNLQVDYINEHILKTFGQMIKIRRHLAKLTLRELASHSGLSHTLLNKIEHGLVPITEESYEKITRALRVNFMHDEEKNQRFFELRKQVKDALFYVAIPNILPKMEQIEIEEPYYLNSCLTIDYIVLFIGVYNYPHHGKMEKTKMFLQAIDYVSDMLDSNLYEDYALYRGIYYFNLKEYEVALDNLHKGLDNNPSETSVPLYNYFLGRTYGESYKLTKSTKYFKIAMQLFERQNNMRRAVYARLYIAVNRMKMADFDQLIDELNFIEQYAIREKLTGLTYVTRINTLIYHILRHDYLQAIETASKIQNKTGLYYYYLAYAQIKENLISEALKTIQIGENEVSKSDYQTKIDTIGFDFLEGIIDPENTENYETILEEYFYESIKSCAYNRTQIAFKYYREMLVEKRLYKKAYDITKLMIDMNKKVMK
ncbi:helix-turn-helix domain-containing protein [Liberiplasma polymorphum]|uniref:helix-turn-helix domain-containing protein n=1 Tax=Liberiplasma polymorphum TaxID=3374570 RepID=UPI003775709A